jgi:hypothetical protein
MIRYALLIPRAYLARSSSAWRSVNILMNLRVSRFNDNLIGLIIEHEDGTEEVIKPANK